MTAAAAVPPAAPPRAAVSVPPNVMHALRLRQLARCLVNQASSVCATGGSRGVSTRALYHKRNPFDFRVVREDGEELLVKSLETSIDEMDETRKKWERGKDEAKAAALKLLSARSHSRRELKNKLLERGFELNDVRAALDRLAEVGLQSDAEFADTFARSKWRQSKWGPRRIEQELLHRGVSPELATAALQSVFGGSGLDVRQHIEHIDDEEQPQQQPGMHAAPEQVLLEDARKHWARMDRLPDEARRRRFLAWMQRRGHRWDDIRVLLHQLEKEDAHRALDGEDEEDDA